MKAAEIAQILPAVFRDILPYDPTLAALLDISEGLQDPVEMRLADLSLVFNALVTEDRFAPMLARWVDLVWLYADDDAELETAAQAWSDSGIPAGRLRMLIGTAHILSQERGTARGLVRFLEIATGVAGFAVDDALGPDTPFHLRVHVPQAAAPQMTLIERIVNAEKPAYVTWESVVA
jgi:hypothetical protein